MPELLSTSLAPFAGVDPRIMDDRLVDGTRLRGGQNVVVNDGEWWSRAGLQWLLTMPRAFGDTNQIQWTKIVTYEDTNAAGTSTRQRTFFCSKYGVMAHDASVGDNITPWHFAYGSMSSTTVNATSGAIDVNSAGAIAGAFIWVEASGNVYGVKNTAGPNFRIDRPWQEATGAYTVKIVPTMVSSYSLTSELTDAAIFRQIAGYPAGGEVYTSSPIVTGPATYLVLCFGPSAADDPIAIRVDEDTSSAPIENFFRDSSSSTPTTKLAIQPRFVRAYKERLVFGAAADTRGKDQMVTWWYSQPGDLVTWHTGKRLEGGTPNLKKFTDTRDPITGLEVSADLLTVHRAESQSMVQFQPTGQFGLDEQPNRQGFGLQTNDWKSLIVANNAQYLLTEGGPATFANGQLSYIDPALSDLFLRFRDFLALTTPDYTGHVGWHAPEQGMLGWILRTTTLMGSQSRRGVPWIVLDYRRDRWMLWVVPMNTLEYVTAASADFIATSRGIILKVPTPIWGGVANDDLEIEDFSPTDTAVDVVAETPWIDLGVPEQKWLERLDVVLRAPHQPSAAGSLGGVSDPLTFTVKVYADYRETVAETFSLEVAHSEFSNESGFVAPARVVRPVPLNVQGSVFRLRFSGDPFRLSNVIAWYRPTESREKELP